jgi:broad specificity phosphatase PhoE
MPRLYLIRHAKPAAAWGEDPDPGLDSHGEVQARATAQHLAASLARMPVYSSPMRRCRETAVSICALWKCEAQIYPPASEIPTPPLDPSLRRAWLSDAVSGTWTQLHNAAPAGAVDYLEWRRNLIDSLLGIPHDCVIYTHFIAINVAAGAATGSEQVVCFRPDHASVTVVETHAGRLHLLELGREAETPVLAGRPGV